MFVSISATTRSWQALVWLACFSSALTDDGLGLLQRHAQLNRPFHHLDLPDSYDVDATLNPENPEVSLSNFERSSRRDALLSWVPLPSETGAVCLDGSPAGYYFAPGDGDNASKWLVHLQAGAWCLDEEDCGNRAKSDLGSTATAADSTTINGLYGEIAGQGILSSDPRANPDFFDWSLVLVRYCDGASFSGDREEPVRTREGQQLFMRGRRILDATIASLLQRGLSIATNVILAGYSAGGLATLVHADYIRHQLPSTTDMVAIADAGLFMTNGQDRQFFHEAFEHIVAMQNTTTALDASCLQSHSSDTAWRCFLAEDALPMVETPLFVIQSLYDSWQVQEINGLACFGEECQGSERQIFDQLAEDLKATIATVPEKSGVFALPCSRHGLSVTTRGWTKPKVEGLSLRDAFVKWYHTRSSLVLLDNGPYDPKRC